RQLFPLGRLREPLAGLGRADVFLITRSDKSDLVPAIEWTLRHWNERAPIFHAAVRPTGWVEHPTGNHLPIGATPFNRVAAFCGLGNPEPFRRTLQILGLDVAEWIEFPDHHHYPPHELRRLSALGHASRATALVTTQN